jgi:hypothetical protein
MANHEPLKLGAEKSLIRGSRCVSTLETVMRLADKARLREGENLAETLLYSSVLLQELGPVSGQQWKV